MWLLSSVIIKSSKWKPPCKTCLAQIHNSTCHPTWQISNFELHSGTIEWLNWSFCIRWSLWWVSRLFLHRFCTIWIPLFDHPKFVCRYHSKFFFPILGLFPWKLPFLALIVDKQRMHCIRSPICWHLRCWFYVRLAYKIIVVCLKVASLKKILCICSHCTTNLNFPSK